MNMVRAAWRGLWQRLAALPGTEVCGFRVLIEHDGPEREGAALLARLQRVIRLAEAAMPTHVAAMREHVGLIQVTRFPCRGAFVADSRILIVERTFLADPSRLDAEIGATLVHEGEHARLRGTGLAETMSQAEEERACRAVEIAFGERVPGGERVLERAHAAMQLTDPDVAPDVNWQEAWSRVDGH